MRKMTARFLWAVCIVGTITGCGAKGTFTQTPRMYKGEAVERAVQECGFGRQEASVEITPGDVGESSVSRDAAPETSAPESEIGPSEEESAASLEPPAEAVPEKEQEAQDRAAEGMVYRKDPLTEEPEEIPVSPGPSLKVPEEQADSQKEEKTEAAGRKPEPDENDASIGQPVQAEAPVPSKYWNQAGDLRYEYREGVWYEYRYSNGDIKLDEQNEKLALQLLNKDGFYNGYEVLKLECTREINTDGSIQYEYHVRYRRIVKLEQKPSDLDQLQKEDPGKAPPEAGTQTEQTAPILADKVAGTENAERPDSEEENKNPGFRGVNVSEQNGDIDWGNVRRAGVDFAMIRCAYRDPKEGILTKDSKAEVNIEAARAAGIETGIFFTSGAVSKREAMEEADFTVMMAERHHLNGPIAVFLEAPDPAKPRRTDQLDTAGRTSCVKGFCQVVRMSGFEPVICGDAGWIRENLNTEELSGYLLWIPNDDKNVTYTVPCEDWHCTKGNSADGISGYTGLLTSHGELGGTSK